MKLATTISIIIGVVLTTGSFAGYKANNCWMQPTVQTPVHEPIKDAELMTLSTLSVLVY